MLLCIQYWHIDEVVELFEELLRIHSSLHLHPIHEFISLARQEELAPEALKTTASIIALARAGRRLPRSKRLQCRALRRRRRSLPLSDNWTALQVYQALTRAELTPEQAKQEDDVQ